MELRFHPKLRTHWPPESGGAIGRGVELLPTTEKEDRLQAVFYYAPVERAAADVVLKTIWRGHAYTRDILLHDEAFAERLARFLKQTQIGRTIGEIERAEIDF